MIKRNNKEEDICMSCEHYIEETDYCDLDQFDGEEKDGLGEKKPLDECIFYKWKDEKGHIYPWQHSLL